ncbi:unnamed protein product [Vicia faba]|uniref:Uncharacterized protein n=1 Tax=Vicia faba TaxID=3906 RepID=A0AAV1AUL4_VICFA|nr:unnamed protein product [Vicia faba]
MATICQETQPLLLDMKVTIHKTSMVFPSKQTEKKSLFLSNIDKVLNFDVKTVHFFEANNDFPPEIVTEKLRKALEDALVDYEFLAGRVKMNSETNRLEIDCSAEGVGFVVASSEYTLDQIGDLAYPNEAFTQFVHNTKEFLKIGDIPLCVVQLSPKSLLLLGNARIEVHWFPSIFILYPPGEPLLSQCGNGKSRGAGCGSLEVIAPYADTIHISDSFDYMRSSDNGGDESGGLRGDEGLEEPVEKDTRANPFRFDIKEIGHGFSFTEVHVENLERVENY